MAQDAHITVKGDVQGDFPGTSLKSGRSETMEVWGYSHELDSQHDLASGTATGRRQHGVVTIIKAVDKASPYFVNALIRNENLPVVTIQFYHPSPQTGREINFFTIELTNATVANITQEQLNNQYPDNMSHELREHIAFAYQTITWTSNVGNTTASDDWLA